MIRTCIIGFGLSGAKFHAPFLKVIDGFEVTHVVSRREDEVKQVFPTAITVSQQDLENMIFQNPEIDLVIITSPNGEHYPQAKKALESGKHVVVEKPFVLTTSEGEELITLAKQKNRILTIFHNRRWDSDYLQVKDMIEKRTLGNISYFTSRFDRYRPIVRTEKWKETNIRGSGVLWDLAPHLIDQSLQLFGVPRKLIADLSYQRPNSQNVDYFDITFLYNSNNNSNNNNSNNNDDDSNEVKDDNNNEMRVKLCSSSMCRFPTYRFEIHGDRGSFVKSGLDIQEKTLVSGSLSPLSPEFGVEPPEMYGSLSVSADSNDPFSLSSSTCAVPSFKGQYIEFYRTLKEAICIGGAPPVTADDALCVIKLILLCEISHQQRGWVDVNLI